MNEDLQISRKQLVYILNYSLDILKKDPIEASDLIYFSNEVKRFNLWLDSINIPAHIKNNLKEISFNYSPNREKISDSLFLFLRNIFASWLIQKHRTMLINDFLSKYDKNLKLFD